MNQPMTPAAGGNRTDTPSGSPEAAVHYLTFSLDNQAFAMDIRSVREIIQYGPMTTVPLMPAFVRGVINLRGAIVPVIDLRSRFGRSAGVVGEKTCIVIVESLRDGERIELGLMVDGVSEVIEFTREQVEPPPDFGTALRHDFMRGMVKLSNRFVIILDPERAFDIDEMASLCEVGRMPMAA